ncbi:MAG: hypothetical protein KI785_02815 [Devosiaceae bacterium]|nr:hypothetical protein [Devosiaceae bacterium MH13]
MRRRRDCRFDDQTPKAAAPAGASAPVVDLGSFRDKQRATRKADAPRGEGSATIHLFTGVQIVRVEPERSETA